MAITFVEKVKVLDTPVVLAESLKWCYSSSLEHRNSQTLHYQQQPPLQVRTR